MMSGIVDMKRILRDNVYARLQEMVNTDKNSINLITVNRLTADFHNAQIELLSLIPPAERSKEMRLTFQFWQLVNSIKLRLRQKETATEPRPMMLIERLSTRSQSTNQQRAPSPLVDDTSNAEDVEIKVEEVYVGEAITTPMDTEVKPEQSDDVIAVEPENPLNVSDLLDEVVAVEPQNTLSISNPSTEPADVAPAKQPAPISTERKKELRVNLIRFKYDPVKRTLLIPKEVQRKETVDVVPAAEHRNRLIIGTKPSSVATVKRLVTVSRGRARGIPMNVNCVASEDRSPGPLKPQPVLSKVLEPLDDVVIVEEPENPASVNREPLEDVVEVEESEDPASVNRGSSDNATFEDAPPSPEEPPRPCLKRVQCQALPLSVRKALSALQASEANKTAPPVREYSSDAAIFKEAVPSSSENPPPRTLIRVQGQDPSHAATLVKAVAPSSEKPPRTLIRVQGQALPLTVLKSLTAMRRTEPQKVEVQVRPPLPPCQCKSKDQVLSMARKKIKRLNQLLIRKQNKITKLKAKLVDAQQRARILLKAAEEADIANVFTALQMRYTKTKDRGRRFTPKEKAMALALYKKSPKSYSLLSQMFCLPSKKTLLAVSRIIKFAESGGVLTKELLQKDDIGHNEGLEFIVEDGAEDGPEVGFHWPEETQLNESTGVEEIIEMESIDMDCEG